MSIKRVLFVVLVAGAVVLAVSVNAQTPGQETSVSHVTVPYSGRLADLVGQPVPDDVYDFTFALYDVEAGGQPLWTETQPGVTVQGGTFSVSLGSKQPLPQALLAGGVHWLSVGVRGPLDPELTVLAPRQRLSAAPAAPIASPNTGAACPHDHWGEVWSGTVLGLTLESTDSVAKATLSSNDQGVYGLGGNVGVFGEARGESVDTYGVFGLSTNGPGVYGTSSTGHGVHGYSVEGHGVHGYGNSEHGVYGETYGNWAWRSGVFGRATGDEANGVTGWASFGGVGVYGHSESGYAGYFSGPVHVTGYLSKAGGGFKIDHPLDPAGKYLSHSFVESPDMKNVYDGVVVLNGDGSAWVALPEWFEALNSDFRYQLTCIGGFAPVYIAHEVQHNRFQIAGGEPGMKVSWQVTGVRHDAYAKAHPLPVEEDKPAEEQGTYLHPVEHGMPESMALDTHRYQDPADAPAGGR